MNIRPYHRNKLKRFGKRLAWVIGVVAAGVLAIELPRHLLEVIFDMQQGKADVVVWLVYASAFLLWSLWEFPSVTVDDADEEVS